MNRNETPVKIVPGYTTWIHQSARAASKQIVFGTWWRLDATYWRVSWIEATGELYAVELSPSDQFVVLDHLAKKEFNELMRRWYDGNNLHALFLRFGQHQV
ncbi:MAG TPA: hypothetical protein VFD70_27595 [Anaerolineae bacterium]|nr:hypothetical protein [Anaerolineae bacterium]